MKTLLFANQKGGVGKSALACQIAYYLAESGKRVLFLDLDHQQNSTRPISKSGRAAVASFNTYQLFEGQGATLPDGTFVLIPGHEKLTNLDRQPDKHNGYVNSLKNFLDSAAERFDVCILDSNPNPDIRYAAAMISCNFVLSPIQLNQEALDGIGSLLDHERYGYRKIKAALNPTMELIGLLPNIVEPTPFQRANFKQLVETFAALLLKIDTKAYAFIPKRSVVAEAQAQGDFIRDIKKSAARDTWREIQPTFDAILQRMALKA